MKNVILALLMVLTLQLGAQTFTLGESTEVGSAIFEHTAQHKDLSFVIQGPEALSQIQINKVNEFLREIGTWKNFEVKSLKISFTEDLAKILLVPAQFLVETQDLAPLIPSGILFEMDSFLRFDFRLVVDGIFVRLSGGLFSFVEFQKTLADVLKNPLLYIQRNDPLYLFNQQKEMREELIQLRSLATELQDLKYSLSTVGNRDFFGTTYPMDKEEIEKVKQIYLSNSSKSRKEIAESYRSSGGKLTEHEVYLVLGVWFSRFSE